MILYFGFLLKDRLIREDIWNLFFENELYYSGCHCYIGQYTGNLKINQVDTVECTWAKTLGGHYQLYKDFLKTNSTHFILVSDSCIPIATLKEVQEHISRQNGTILTYHSHFKKVDYGQFWSTGHKWRNYPIGLQFKSHEQWVILTRKEVELLVKNEELIEWTYRHSNAENETYIGTFLAQQQGFKIAKGRHWYIDWKRGCHPETIIELTHTKLQQIRNGSVFLRKVSEESNLETIKELLNGKY